jgi:hypothetical protein
VCRLHPIGPHLANTAITSPSDALSAQSVNHAEAERFACENVRHGGAVLQVEVRERDKTDVIWKRKPTFRSIFLHISANFVEASLN